MINKLVMIQMLCSCVKNKNLRICQIIGAKNERARTEERKEREKEKNKPNKLHA
jgi:hypothetical protein